MIYGFGRSSNHFALTYEKGIYKLGEKINYLSKVLFSQYFGQQTIKM
jgi:hypothetical protein|tara:strand:+ start:1430 stop:1570 length:141 start_codon:yes stop_codon:yes gene_type:complete